MGIECGPAPRIGPSLAELSQVHGRGLVQVIVSRVSPFTWHCFINGEYVPDVDLEDLLLHVELPEDGDVSRATVQAYLTCKRDGLTGTRESQTLDLFPATIDLLLDKHRLVVTCAEKGSIESVSVMAGLQEDGSCHILEGIRALKVVISYGIMDARITWMDGQTESLFGVPTVVN